MEQKNFWDKRFSTEIIDNEVSFLKKYSNILLSLGEKPLALDLGCGDGNNSEFLYQLGFEVIASDFSNKALEKVSKRCSHINTIRFDMTETFPFESNSFDLVVASLSIQYFYKKETDKILLSIFNTLKEGGIFIIRVNNDKELQINKKKDIVKCLEDEFYLSKNGKTKRYYTKESLRRFLFHFEILEMKDVEFEFLGNKKYALESVVRKRG